MQRANCSIAPAFATSSAREGFVCLKIIFEFYFAMQAKAYAAPSFTLGSNSSRQVTRASRAPASITL
jgi:hypothetical protein